MTEEDGAPTERLRTRVTSADRTSRSLRPESHDGSYLEI